MYELQYSKPSSVNDAVSEIKKSSDAKFLAETPSIGLLEHSKSPDFLLHILYHSNIQLIQYSAFDLFFVTLKCHVNSFNGIKKS